MKVLLFLFSLLLVVSAFSSMRVTEYKGYIIIDDVMLLNQQCALDVKSIEDEVVKVTFNIADLAADEELILTKDPTEKFASANYSGNKLKVFVDKYGNPVEFEVVRNGELLSKCIGLAREY